MGRTTHWRLRAWWDGRDLVVRWSLRVGQWLEPCVLAARVKSPRAVNPDALLAVNRLGDALAVWSAKGRVPTLWARFRPAGHGWSEPIRVTRASSIPVAYTADLGDGGHAAIAWMPRNGREIHVVRTLGAAPAGEADVQGHPGPRVPERWATHRAGSTRWVNGPPSRLSRRVTARRPGR
jgi:hypothetical protein